MTKQEVIVRVIGQVIGSVAVFRLIQVRGVNRSVNSCCPCSAFHFFFRALSAALVCLPSSVLGVAALMTPTATVCLMSRTANLPRGGSELKASTHIGLEGCKTTIAASPDLMNLELSSVDLPVRRSTFSLISANLQAM